MIKPPNYTDVMAMNSKRKYGKDFVPYQNKWQEYERKKKRMADWGLTAEEYEAEIKKIAEKLGI